MRQMKTLLLMMIIASASISLVGCKEEGPAERLGERIDEAGKDAESAAKEAERDLKKAVDD